ncbi:hypothetical protein L6164_018128 [Bauhinia variegata]|uniref:Uncharacterized protein n=1 Tax=Bauhinia variegata TaxID=167791 RepID=A0ACB9NA23_BAUVA|nr:hypothetical protein L6164_018128 [Bauhinia variegata]
MFSFAALQSRNNIVELASGDFAFRTGNAYSGVENTWELASVLSASWSNEQAAEKLNRKNLEATLSYSSKSVEVPG